MILLYFLIESQKNFGWNFCICCKINREKIFIFKFFSKFSSVVTVEGKIWWFLHKSLRWTLYFMLCWGLNLADPPWTVDLGVNVFTMFKIKYLEFPWFDFLYSWWFKRQTYKLQICWNDSGDPQAFSKLLAIDLTVVNFLFARMMSKTFERNCPLFGDIFNGFFFKVLKCF